MFHAYKYISEQYEVAAFLDNNANKQGMIIDGKPVISIHDLNRFDYECIIVTPSLHQSICMQLLDFGVPLEKIILLRDLVDYSQYKGMAKFAFCLQGNLTDYLVAANYIWHFAKNLLSSSGYIDVYCTSGSGYAHFVFEGNELVQHIFDSALEFFEFSDYDLVVQLNPYPVVLRRDDYFLPRLAPKVVEYALVCERFRIFHEQLLGGSRFTENRPIVFQEIRGDNWIQAPDIERFLGASDDYQYVLPLPEGRDLQIMEDKLPWVVLCSLSSESVKDWPETYWNSLRNWIVKTYAEHWIVDIVGIEDNEYLVDWMRFEKKICTRLSLREMAVLLRESKLAVGTDNPLIHLRYAVHGGPSIVLFGATSEKAWGCPGNENLRGTGCKHWCEGVTEYWRKRCIRGRDMSPCMASITPEWVIGEIRNVLARENRVQV